MKIPRNEFKIVIKECLKELIAEGALNNAIAQLIQNQGIPISGMQNVMPTDPRIQAVAQSVARNGGDAKLYETIFTDAIGTMAYQNGVDPQQMMQNNMGAMGGMGMNGMMPQQQMMQQPMAGNYYQDFGQQPQQMMPMQPQYMSQMPVQQQPMMQQPQNQLMLHQQGQQQQGQGGGISRWAQLAFNSPIKNRPDGEGGMPGMGNSGSPGSNMGKFD